MPNSFERTFWNIEGADHFKVDENINTLIPSPGFGYNDNIKQLIPKI